MNDPSGSIWRKWDLHVHPPASFLNNQFGNNWDKYVQALFKKAIEKEICVIGITDYFTIDGYKKVRDEYLDNDAKLSELFTNQEIDFIKNILILPNVEFRLNKFVGENSINFHVIFSEKLQPKQIEENFLHNLDFVYAGTPQSKEEKHKLKPNNLIELGKRLKSEHAKFSSEDDLKIGMMNAVVNDEQISEVVESHQSKFIGKYLLGVAADEDLSKIHWDSQDHQTRKVLIQKSDVLFSSNPNTRQWALGKHPYADGPKKFIKEFKTLKPCIHGSDAHKYVEIGHPCVKRNEANHDCSEDPSACELRFCWIKADTTFEGLKQILYEPSERITIQERDPTPLKSNYSMVAFNLRNANSDIGLSIQETELKLNLNLVAVAGGKGSGKTALVDLLANCYVNRCETDDKNSFVRRVAQQIPTIETTLSFKDGSDFSKTITDGNFFEESQICYIAQGELENYIGDESDLDKYVQELIFESPYIKDTVISSEFSDLVGNIEALENNISEDNLEIEKFERKAAPSQLRDLQMEIRQHIAELKDVRQKIKLIEKGKSPEKVQLAREKQKQLTHLKNKKSDINQIRQLLTDCIRFIESDISTFNEKIITINNVLKKLEITVEMPELSYEKMSDLKLMVEKANSMNKEVISSIEKVQIDINKYEESIKEHTRLLDKKREIAVQIHELKAKVKEIEGYKRQIDNILKERKSRFLELIRTIISLRKKYEEIIEVFSAHKAEVLSDLDFVAQINFGQDRFVKTAMDVLDNRKVPVEDSDDAPSVFNNLFKIISAVIEDNEENIENLVNEIERIDNQLKTKIKSSRAITIKDFYDFLYFNYFEVAPVVRYKKTNLNLLSLGQKATVLIKIYLAQGDRPIIIDSHDDHLDNEFIMEELVNAIREAKNHRQIILVSNNGNVVINSDAEQIIIANRNDAGEISYMSGSIENPIIRDRAINILEGGPLAFKKRQEKYRIT